MTNGFLIAASEETYKRIMKKYWWYAMYCLRLSIAKGMYTCNWTPKGLRLLQR